MNCEEHPEVPPGYYCYVTNSIEYGEKTEVSAKFAELCGQEDKGFPILHTTPCPHWGRDTSRPDQENGFCKLLGINDWTEGTLLWDQVKACNFNIDQEPDEPMG